MKLLSAMNPHLNRPKWQSSCLNIKFNFSTKSDKLLFRFGMCLITILSVAHHLILVFWAIWNPVTKSVTFREKISTWLTVTKSKLPQPRCGSGSPSNSPEEILLRFLTGFWMHLCFLLLAKVCVKAFIKKEIVCFLPIASIWR